MALLFRIYDRQAKTITGYDEVKDQKISDIFQNPDRIILPAAGRKTEDGTDIHAGDILQLDITEELLDTMFANSNLGIRCIETKTKTVFTFLHTERTGFEMPFSVYMKGDPAQYPDTDGWVSCESEGSDTSLDFINYVCAKGAFVAGNIFQNPELLPAQVSKDLMP